MTVFLATTALEDFWDLSGPVLFLGDWCRRHSRREIWQSANGSVLPSPWADPARLDAANEYVAEVYERALEALVPALNAIHNIEHTTRYWRIVVGPWLQQYVAVIYDRYTLLNEALRVEPELTTIVLAKDSWITPADTMGLVQLLKDDPYNLQLFSRILAALGKSFPGKSLRVSAPRFLSQQRRALTKTAIIGGMRTMAKLFCGPGDVALRSSYFSPKFELQLLLGTRGHVWPLPGPLSTTDVRPLDIAKRNLLKVPFATNDFERLLIELLPFDIPQSFVEAYEPIGEEAKREYPRTAKAIFSSEAWYYDEPFKQWAAKNAERGTLLLGTQHGGGYGADKHFPIEAHELVITDLYFSWGWTSQSSGATVIPLGAAKLSGRRRIGASNEKQGILYVVTAWMRYLTQFYVPPHIYGDYLTWHPRFVNALDPQLLRELRVRFHREDLGWDVPLRWQEFAPDIPVETWDVTFWDSLCSSRIFVCDHATTTFLEALAADKPSILFWPRPMNAPRAEAEPYYDLLRKAGILHDDPESAAATLESVHDDVETWWNAAIRQDARRRFCDRFARVPDDPLRMWTEVFKRIAAGDRVPSDVTV